MSARRFRTSLVAAGLGVLILAACAFALVPTYWILLGWQRGERFYQGKPTSYWHHELENHAELWSPISGDWHLVNRETSDCWPMPRFLSPRKPATLPLLDGDPAAFPVLRELLSYPDLKSRRVAATGLGNIGPGARESGPALIEIAQTASDYALYLCACDAVRAVDPLAAAAANLERPPGALRSELGR